MQFRARRDEIAGALIAVAQVGRDDELAPAAFFHAGHAFVPALDDSAGAQREIERPVPVAAAVELLAVLERSGVVDGDGLPGLRDFPGADLEVFVLQPRFRGDDGPVLLVLLVPPFRRVNRHPDDADHDKDKHDGDECCLHGDCPFCTFVDCAATPDSLSRLGIEINWHFGA